jgi:hypothetical protein
MSLALRFSPGMNNHPGQIVSGDDFFDRDWELQQLLEHIEAIIPVLLSAPRRVGKSSLLLKALETLRGKGWVSLNLDFQDKSTEEEFFAHLIEAIEKAGVRLPLLDRTKKTLKAVKHWRPSKVTVGTDEGSFSAEWDAPDSGKEGSLGLEFEKLLGALSEKHPHVVIGMDEFPIFLAKLQAQPDGPARVDALLRWLRRVRLATTNRLVWVFCGSIGLDTFVQIHGLEGTINDLVHQKLGPFDEATARQCLFELAKSPQNPLRMTDTLATAIIEKIGWLLPYYIQLMYHALRSLPPGQRSKDFPAPADVDAAYELLLEPGSATYFSHWDSRLDEQLDPARAATCRFLLKTICLAKKGVTRARLLTAMIARRPQSDPEEVERDLIFALEMLERDGYLHRDGNLCAFRSPLLRDFWKRRNT